MTMMMMMLITPVPKKIQKKLKIALRKNINIAAKVDTVFLLAKKICSFSFILTVFMVFLMLDLDNFDNDQIS